MTGKHNNWHRAWSRDQAGHLVHTSGLRVLVQPADDGAIDLEAEEASLAIFQAKEGSRGVPLHDLAARLQRLLREAAEWHQRNP